MRRVTFAFLAAIMMIATFAVTTASAASPHVVYVDFNDLGAQLEASGKVAGVGHKRVTMYLQGTGMASLKCERGTHNVFLQNRLRVNQVNISYHDEDGHFRFVLTTPPSTLAQFTPVELGCPSNDYTVSVYDVRYEYARITLVQGGETKFSERYGASYIYDAAMKRIKVWPPA